MARLSSSIREMPELQYPLSDSADDDCIVLASTADTASKTSASTRPTSVSSNASLDAPTSAKGKKKRPSTMKSINATKTRGAAPSDLPIPSKAATLLGFGFTKSQGSSTSASNTLLHMPKRASPRRTTRQPSSFLEPRSDDDLQRQASPTITELLLQVQTTSSATTALSSRKRKAEDVVDTLAGAQEVKSLTMANLQSVAQTNAYRDLSGATLVEHKEEGPAEVEEQGKPSKRETSSEADEDIPGLPDHSKGKAKEKSSILGKLKGKIASVKSTLGKRGRDVKDALERGKEKLQSTGGRKSTRLSIMETKQEDVYDEEDDDMEGPPKKKFKQSSDTASPRTVSTPMRPSTMTDRPLGKSKSTKPWMGSGLFVGQDRHFDARLTGAQNKKKRAAMTPAQLAENRYLPLPMFSGEDMLTTGRTFRLPWDVYNPLPPGQPKPDEWRKAQANRVVGDAVHVVNEWRKFSKLPVSHCECTADTGCHDHCLNRIMSYECNSGNCKLGHEECGNRAFADLKERVDNVKGVKERSKEGKKYDIGVEVVKTHGKGFGVRASRTFDPGQIIVEYAGEIITVEECDRRMVEEYKDNTCYYLMNFVDKLIIDASRTGSIARFVNHSCEPNCSMIQWTVAGKPRMALFAGDAGISTGEELTYDYNFDNFNDDNTTACACGAEWCRGVLGKKPTEQAIKRAKSQKERERLVAVKMEMERVEAEKREKVNGKKRKKHVGWAYVDAHGNDVEPPVEESEEEEKPAKKQRLTATITEKVKDGEVGRSRSVLRKKKLVRK